jgi:hypothetical protein
MREAIDAAKWAFATLKTVDYSPVIAQLDSAIDLVENQVGPADTSIATAMAWKGCLLGWSMKLDSCESILQEALRRYESVLAPDHPASALALWILAGYYHYSGRSTEGHQAGQRAHQLMDRYPDFDPELYARVLKDRALRYVHRQDYATHDSLRLKALGIIEQLHGPDHWLAGEIRWGLGFWWIHHKDLDTGQAWMERGLRILEESIGKNIPRTAIGYEHLSDAYRLRGQYEKAYNTLLYTQSVIENGMGADHPWAAEQSRRLAMLELENGHYDRALMYAERAADLGQRSGITLWPSGDFWTEWLARAYRATGEFDKSLATYRDLIASKQRFAQGIFRYASEEAKLAYLQRNTLIDHAFLSLPSDQWSDEAKETALQMLLAGKAIVVDALAAGKRMAYCDGDPDLAEKTRNHASVCGEIANLTLSGGIDLVSQALHDSLQALYQAKEALESDGPGRRIHARG